MRSLASVPLRERWLFAFPAAYSVEDGPFCLGNRKISSLNRRNSPFLYKYVLYLPVFFCYTVCLLMWNIVCSA